MITFDRVVKYGSFTAAADELGLSRAVVSRHVVDLEEHFGLRLLNRTTRSVTPTEAGQNYHDLCRRVLSEIRKGEESLAAIKGDIEGEISMLCPVWIGNFDISKAVVDFCRDYPKIEVKMHIGEVSPNPHEFLTKGYDICIHPNDMRDSEVIAKKIGEIDYILVASPEYIAQRGQPSELKHLLEHDCLVNISEPYWSFKGGERISIRVTSRFSSNSFFSLCTASLSGLGIAMLPRKVAMMEIAAGRLCPVLPHLALEAKPVYAAYAPGGSMPRKVRALITHLTNWFAEHAKAPDRKGQVVELFSEGRLSGLHR
jgi:DNA-binding transcriptional LysR family regulator